LKKDENRLEEGEQEDEMRRIVAESSEL